MDQTAKLGMPLIMPSQAQKHVTHNSALAILDALTQAGVISRALAAPPAAPAEGDGYIVAAPASDAWLGKEDAVASWQAGGWLFATPREGWRVWVAAEAAEAVYAGGAWVLRPAEGGSALARFGINTEADATNRLSVRSAATLLVGEDGDHRLTISKSARTNTASLVFQTNFSGRAEFGLAGDDNWHVKVSADGASWAEPVVVSAMSGNVKLGTADGSATASLHVFSPVTAGGYTKPFKVHVPALPANNTVQFAVGVAESQYNQAEFNFHYVSNGSTGNYFNIGMFGVAGGMIQVYPTGEVRLPLVGTTASAANAYIDSANSNRILRSTSSRAYKHSIEPLEPSRAHALMALEPIWYRSRVESDRPDWSWYGFAAEDVAAVDPRMVHWGYRPDDYETVAGAVEENGRPQRRLRRGARPKPDGVAYDRFVAHHHVLLKDLLARVARLEAAARGR